MSHIYSVSTNFRLELMEPSARELFILPEEMGGANGEERREHGSSLAKLETASEPKNIDPKPF